MSLKAVPTQRMAPSTPKTGRSPSKFGKTKVAPSPPVIRQRAPLPPETKPPTTPLTTKRTFQSVKESLQRISTSITKPLQRTFSSSNSSLEHTSSSRTTSDVGSTFSENTISTSPKSESRCSASNLSAKSSQATGCTSSSINNNFQSTNDTPQASKNTAQPTYNTEHSTDDTTEVTKTSPQSINDSTESTNIVPVKTSITESTKNIQEPNSNTEHPTEDTIEITKTSLQSINDSNESTNILTIKNSITESTKNTSQSSKNTSSTKNIPQSSAKSPLPAVRKHTIVTEPPDRHTTQTFTPQITHNNHQENSLHEICEQDKAQQFSGEQADDTSSSSTKVASKSTSDTQQTSRLSQSDPKVSKQTVETLSDISTEIDIEKLKNSISTAVEDHGKIPDTKETKKSFQNESQDEPLSESRKIPHTNENVEDSSTSEDCTLKIYRLSSDEPDLDKHSSIISVKGSIKFNKDSSNTHQDSLQLDKESTLSKENVSSNIMDSLKSLEDNLSFQECALAEKDEKTACREKNDRNSKRSSPVKLDFQTNPTDTHDSEKYSEITEISGQTVSKIPTEPLKIIELSIKNKSSTIDENNSGLTETSDQSLSKNRTESSKISDLCSKNESPTPDSSSPNENVPKKLIEPDATSKVLKDTVQLNILQINEDASIGKTVS